MLVDDHNLFRQALSVILERHMDLEENVQARSRAEARQAFSDLEGKVDLAIVDLSLPEGTEPIQELHHLDFPVLAITADPSQERCARALGAETSEVLSTVSSAEKIIDVAQRLING